jgi:uncharacterized integral membrane protein
MGPHEAEQPLHEPLPPEERPRSLITVKRLISAILLALVLTFLAQNGAAAHMHFLGLSFSLPVGVAILISAVAGGFVALVVTAAGRRRARVRARRH